MADECRHAEQVKDVKPSARGCEECLKTGSEWVHLRLCRTCGHVGCCDDSPNKHATRHFHATRHPVIEGYDPPEGWGWCFVDEIFLDLSDRQTPQDGPIPRFISPCTRDAACDIETATRQDRTPDASCPGLVRLPRVRLWACAEARA